MHPCPVCGGPTVFLSEFRGINRDVALELELFRGRRTHRCSTCGYGWCIDPISADVLDEYYRSFYWNEQTPAPSFEDTVRWRLRGLQPIRKDTREASIVRWEPVRHWLSTRTKVRSLEVGAGAAGYSRALRRATQRPRLEAVEPSDRFLPAYRAWGVDRVARTLDGCEGPYDIIAATHVVEHFIDAPASLARMRDLLAPGGLLLVEVPNTEDPYWELRHFPDPPHLHWFTPTSVRRIAENAGFEVLAVTTTGRPIVWEASIGYLDRDSPADMSGDELGVLTRRRDERCQALAAELGMRSLPNGRTVWESSGREALLLAARRPHQSEQSRNSKG